jgi:YD repeat-containing protein
MKHSFFSKTISFFLLFVLLFNMLTPAVSYAATGITQAEFSSYESISATDMVNLSTGDFTFNLPILEVPSPEGGFSLPLAYHAGIQLEEEASWVGLGWSLNAGAIQRNASQYPDDFSGESLNTTISNSGGEGFGINFIFGTYTNDSQKGTGGTVGFGSVIGMGFGTAAGFTAMGVTFSPDNGIKVDAVGVAMSLVTVATMGSSSILSTAFEGGAALGVALNTASALYSYTNMAVGLASTGSSTMSLNDWTITKNNYFFYQSYNYHLDASKSENMYGALYLGDITELDNSEGEARPPVISYGSLNVSPVNSKRFLNQDGLRPVSDMHYYADNSNLSWVIQPSSIGYDNFNVMGDGISGNIKPYRTDVGSLAYPNLGDQYYRRYSPVQFVNSSLSKINFKYDGDFANNYSHHRYGNSEMGIDNNATNLVANGHFNWILYDSHLYSQRREADRPLNGGFKNNHLAGSRHVNWFSNTEISNGTAKSNNFMDFQNSTSRATFRSTLPAKGIGGFSITRADGLTYHYALPVYNKTQKTVSYSVADPNNRTQVINYNPYAINWLLTGITGPDFVDRGEIGIIDGADFGYWVMFNYGNFTSAYHWRTPYDYDTYSASSNDTRQFSEGTKETYYLNSIVTRTHTALFVKSMRYDGKGYYQRGSVPSGTQYCAAFYPIIEDAALSVKLNEIIVLKNEDYAQIGLSYSSFAQSNPTLSNWNAVLDDADITPSMRNLIKDRQIKRIAFNYTYDLCNKTPSSFDGGIYPGSVNDKCSYSWKLGKLTLNSISMRGENDIQTMPDYKFNYGNNPNYSSNNWDGWGVYKSDGTADLNGHASNLEGAEWSLNTITTPLGGEIGVVYERDLYNSVSGNPIYTDIPMTYDVNATTSIKGPQKYNFSTATIPVGSKVTLYGKVEKAIPGLRAPTLSYTTFTKDAIVLSSNKNTIVTNLDFKLDQGLYETAYNDYKRIVSLNLISATFYDRAGGDIRVKQIATKDENGNYLKTQYIYTTNGISGGPSSGVCSVEPDFIRSKTYPFYNYYDYPVTPVLYGKVTVYDGDYIGGKEYTSKNEYNFVTPNSNMVTSTQSPLYDGALCFSGECSNTFKMYNYNLAIKTSSIGSLQSTIKYNNKGLNLNSVLFNYDDGGNFSNMGQFTEGSIMSQIIVTFNADRTINSKVNQLYRTTKNFWPTIPKSVTTTTNGVSTTITKTKYDFITGNNLETEYVSSKGDKYRTRKTPAYFKYPTMGSKVDDNNNCNMLLQEAQNYLFYVNSSNQEVLMGTNVQTWKKIWDYRKYDPTSFYYYVDESITDIWRKEKSFVWSSLINTDGTTANFTDYDWMTATQNKGWKKGNEVTRYSHYSKPLESIDINGNYSSSKMGYNDNFIIASTNNARYAGFVYSGAEDPISGTDWFGGEVGGASKWYPGSVYVKSNYVHTGKYSIRLFNGDFGFLYRGKIGNTSTSDVRQGQTYRASVWLHQDNAKYGVLYCNLKKADYTIATGSFPSVDINSPSTKKIGNWYLLTLDFTVPVSTDGLTMEVCTYFPPPATSPPSTTAIYFDDFRVHPILSPVSAYVYDTKNGRLTATLNQQNFATLYNYDQTGRLKSTYQETLQGFAKVTENSFNYGAK